MADPKKERKRAGRRTKTNDEFQARVFFAAQLLSQLMPTGDIKKALKGRYQCSTSMALKYIARARGEVDKWSGMDKEEVRRMIRAMLQGLLTTGKHWEKLQVIDRLSKMYGLEAPAESKVELSGEVTVQNEQVVNERLDEYRKLYEQLLARNGIIAGNGSGNGSGK